MVPEHVLTLFKQFDTLGCGLIGRTPLTRIVSRISPLGGSDAEELVEQFELANGNLVDYNKFLQWLFSDGEHVGASDGAAAKTHGTIVELTMIAENLESVAARLASQSPGVTSTLLLQAKSLRTVCSQLSASRDVVSSRALSETLVQADVFQNETQNELGSGDVSSFRRRAASLMESSGQRGSMVDDLVEVQASDVKDKLAVSYWRFSGLRLYKSASVSKALRLVCSAPVPGLGETSYLDVFRALTKSGWESHVYLKGGLVRDMLRRQVGNDVDITFAAPVTELEAVCRQQGYPCEVDLGMNYILIGDKAGEEFLEGMLIHHEGSEPDFHADFAMNTLLYDFCNDVIIDKVGIGVPAVAQNRLQIPRQRDKWESWLRRKGLQALFRYYKFLLRGYIHDESEMTFIVDRLLGSWVQDSASTVEEGRYALIGLVGCTDSAKMESLRQWVFMSFEKLSTRPEADGGCTAEASVGPFTSADMWWQRGWRPMLQIE
eukprot:TRINITY_DN56322_c0_g1_i1.p1 TRINITY_DN56322_c0_g1~~TRINITY_DN56322_c0_g1_i1.p1  ORF type:complete len:508 (+),score=76.17 TRINITY_DN56322_c0_g1_i1:52-1524(+)